MNNNELESNIERNQNRLNYINKNLELYETKKIIGTELPIYMSLPAMLYLGILVDDPVFGFVVGSYTTIKLLHNKYNNYNTLNNLKKIKEKLLKEKIVLEACLEADRLDLKKLEEKQLLLKKKQ